MTDKNIAFDSSPTKRRKDENGFLHIDDCPITKEQVVAYYGMEIVGWEELGLEPRKRYKAYRPAAEIINAMGTLNGVPFLLGHAPESAKEPTDQRIGSIGTSASWEPPFLRNAISVTTEEGVKAIETGRYTQLSAGYRYDPDFTPGEFEGIAYDFVMRNIRFNHVAAVEKGRAGSDVVISDSDPDHKPSDDTQGAGAPDPIADENNAPESLIDKEKQTMTLEEIIAAAKTLSREDFNKVKIAFDSDPDKKAEDNDADKKAEDSDEEDDKAEDADPGASEKDKKAEDSDEEDDKANDEAKPATAMDSAAIFKEMSERNQIAEKLSHVIGTFAYDSMSLDGLCKYAAKKLEIDAPKGHEITAVKAYLAAHKKEGTTKLAMDNDPSTSKGADMIQQAYGGK